MLCPNGENTVLGTVGFELSVLLCLFTGEVNLTIANMLLCTLEEYIPWDVQD